MSDTITDYLEQIRRLARHDLCCGDPEMCYGCQIDEITYRLEEQFSLLTDRKESI